TKADEARRLITEATHGRSIDVAGLSIGVCVLAHLVRVVHIAATRPSRTAAHTAGCAGAAHSAALPEDLWVVVCVKVALRGRRGALAWEGAAGSEGAGRLRTKAATHALETSETADAVGAFLIHGLMRVVGKMAAVAVLDG